MQAAVVFSIGSRGIGMCIFVKLARGPSSSFLGLGTRREASQRSSVPSRVMQSLVLDRMSRVS